MRGGDIFSGYHPGGNLLYFALVIGLILILGGWLFLQFILIVFGILIIVKGVLDLLEAVKRKHNLVPLLFAILTLAAGVGACMVQPRE